MMQSNAARSGSVAGPARCDYTEALVKCSGKEYDR